MPNVTYPLDLSGVDPNNLITNEIHTVTESHFKDYYFIVPNFAPFYIDNFSISITTGNITTTLVEDVDFSFALEYVTGTRTTGKAMYGAITLHNLDLNGILNITYQTIGGDHIADRLYVLSYLADKAYNPRTTIWDVITNVPNALPPVPHYQDYDQFYGQGELVAKLGEIAASIASNSSLTQQEIRNFFDAIDNGAFSAYIKKAGDVMTGFLTLSNDPIDPLQAATKQYVDNVADIANLVYTKVDRSGDAMTGPLILPSDPVQPLEATTKQYVDTKNNTLQTQIDTLQTDLTTSVTDLQANKVDKAGDTMTGSLILAADPTQNLEATTKQYVDLADINLQTQIDNVQNSLLTTITTSLANKIDRTGDAMTGPLSLVGNPSTLLEATTKQYVDLGDSALQTQIDTLRSDLTTLTNQTATTQYVDDRIDELYALIFSNLIS